MNNINPNAIAFVALTTVVGHLFGDWAIGAAMGLGLVVLASVASDR